MNYLRNILPLWLREKIYFHFIAQKGVSLATPSGYDLEFAPIKLQALLNTDYGHRQIAWLGYYELSLSRKISSLAKQGGLMVDVGANAGYFSCIWAALNPQNEVYAFEPSPRNLGMLRQNVSALENPERIQIIEQAVGKEAGTLHFDVGPEDQSGWGGLANAGTARTIQVKVCRLDDFLPPTKSISVLKIDTEGADTWVLLGAEKALREKRIKHIFYEVNFDRMQQLGIEPDEAASYLASLDYIVSPIDHQEFYATPR